MSEDLPYQVAPQVEALKQERANCVAYGNETRVSAIDKQLAGLGVKQQAAEKRAEDGETKRSAPPKGRRSAQAQTAEGSGDA